MRIPVEDEEDEFEDQDDSIAAEEEPMEEESVSAIAETVVLSETLNSPVDQRSTVPTAKLPKNCRYHLVEQNNGMHGVYDGIDGGLVLFRTLAEAQRFLQIQLQHRKGFQLFYGSKHNNNED